MIFKEKINWGILSTGEIAKRMATALSDVKNANLIAVSSRSLEKAEKFAQKFAIPRFYGNYEELVQDRDIDIIYIATPNHVHYENILLCLNNGKNVLCEKPFTLNCEHAKEVIELARSKNLFLMEAHKSYFLPGIKKVKELINDNVIGKITMLRVDFCIKPPYNEGHRMFNLALGGGALLDIGVYPISFAINLFGAPAEIYSNTTIGKTGVDIFDAITLKHNNNIISMINCGFNAEGPREALILGENGYIKIHDSFHQAQKITLKTDQNSPVEIDTSFEGNSLNQEAEQATACLMDGKKECEEFTLDMTMEILKVTDYIRKEYNIKYPQEF